MGLLNFYTLTKMSQVYVAGQAVPQEQALEMNSTVEVSAQLLGGKMHGGLARAGKVRKVTPKVEKQERLRKKPTGRAKRRIQYNKRFVTVVSGFGRKRSPNSNQ